MKKLVSSRVHTLRKMPKGENSVASNLSAPISLKEEETILSCTSRLDLVFHCFCFLLACYDVILVDSHIRHMVLVSEETTVTQRVSHGSIDNLACRQKEVRRSTGHIMVTTRYSDQQGSKSRHNVMRHSKQWHRTMPKRFIKPPYSIPRATSIDSDCCRLQTASTLRTKRTNHRSRNQF